MLFVSVCLASPVFANPAILLLPSVGTTKQVTVRGRVLENTPTKGSSTLSRNVRLLASSNWVGAAIEVHFAGRTATGVSGHDGDFEIDVPSGERDFEVGLSLAEASVRGAKSMAIIDVISPTAPFFVISDFDDTIAITNVLQNSKLLESAFLKDGTTHPPVEGMASWYR